MVQTARKIALEASPESAGARFMRLAIEAAELDALTALFADAIAAEGMTQHFCVSQLHSGRFVPLFGDAPQVTAGLGLLEHEDVSRFRPGAITKGNVPAAPMSFIYPVEMPTGESLCVVVAGASGVPSRAAQAKLHGFSAIYATCGWILAERDRDCATAGPLTVAERYILALLLMGRAEIDIALVIGKSVAAVRAHVTHATRKLKAGDRAETIALAARRGWLNVSDELLMEIFDR